MCFVYFCFFFFKQKTAYEMLRSLVGSEMCIRDRCSAAHERQGRDLDRFAFDQAAGALVVQHAVQGICLLYTSDAADDLLCVDLGGRRIIKKKKSHQNQNTHRHGNTRIYLQSTRRSH